MNAANTFAVYPDLGQAQSAILRNGINLFQLVYPRLLRANDKRIHGPFNVRVTEDEVEDPRRIPRAKVEWFTDGRAHLLFERAADRKTSVAWMPDDPGWHNRLILMDNPAYLAMVTQLRLRTGQSLGVDDVRMEIKCLEEVLKEKIPSYDIYREGRRFATYKNKADAEAFISDENADLTGVGPDGIVRVQKRKKINYEIKDTFMLEYRPEILKMIAVEKKKGNQFGWSDNREFNEELKPQVVELIKERRVESPTGESTSDPDTMISRMATWTPDQLKRFRSLLFSHEPGRGAEPVHTVPGTAKNPLRDME